MDHAFLFAQPASDQGAAVRRGLAPFTEAGVATLFEGVSPEEGGAVQAFRNCAASEVQHNWMAFLRVHEFLHVTSPCAPLLLPALAAPP